MSKIIIASSLSQSGSRP